MTDRDEESLGRSLRRDSERRGPDARVTYCQDCGDTFPDHLEWCVTRHPRLQKQPSRWSCLPTSFCMVMDIDVAEAMAHLKHDDERGFHPQELTAWALTKRWCFTPFDFHPELEGVDDNSYLVIPTVPELLKHHPGVLVGWANDLPHAAAWIDGKVHDPNFCIYGPEQFLVETFWLGVKC